MGGSINEFLGPAEGRFFGAGFRRVGHKFRELQTGVVPNGRFGVSGTALLTYPSGWSTKETRSDLKPHLSTVDAFVLAAELTDLLLARQLMMAPEERASAWIRSVEFRSGAAPTESLDEVPVWASMVSVARTRVAIDGPYQSIIDAVIGAIKLRLVICHDVAAYVAPEERLADGIAVLGPQKDRFYGTGYKQHRHHIDDLRFGDDKRLLTARVQVTRCEERDYLSDLGGTYRPSVSILDCIIAQAQIAQVLLYSIDDLDRRETNTLWMRRVRIEARTPYQPMDAAFDARTRVEKTQLVNLHGGVYRSAEFTGTFQGLVSRYSLAHELPASALSSPSAAEPAVVAA